MTIQKESAPVHKCARKGIEGSRDQGIEFPGNLRNLRMLSGRVGVHRRSSAVHSPRPDNLWNRCNLWMISVRSESSGPSVDGRAQSSKSETRMTIEYRSPNSGLVIAYSGLNRNSNFELRLSRHATAGTWGRGSRCLRGRQSSQSSRRIRDTACPRSSRKGRAHTRPACRKGRVHPNVRLWQ